MIKKLTPIGNSLGLIIERPILDLLKIDRDTPLEMTTDGRGIYISPSSDAHVKGVREATARVIRSHGKVLKKLAE